MTILGCIIVGNKGSTRGVRMAAVTKRRRKVGTTADGKPIYRDEGYKVRFVDPEGAERMRVFRKKGEADRFATEVEHRKLSGLYVDPAAGRVTFKEYAEAWRKVQPHRSSTAEQVESRLRLHVYPFIGDRPLAAIRPTELQALIRDRSEHLAPKSLEVVVVWVGTILRAAVADRIITTSPAVRLKLPSSDELEPDPVVLLGNEAIDRIASALPARLSAAIEVGVCAGLRSGEVLGLTVDRVDFLRRTITVDRQMVTTKGQGPVFGPPKTRASRRIIPAPDGLLSVLAAHLAAFPATNGDGLIFTTPAGAPLRRNRWGETWSAATASAELPGTRFHALRHTYASALIAAGCSVKVVQARLGHATAQETLDTYAHLWPDDEDRTRAAVDRFRGAERSDPGPMLTDDEAVSG
jgi:integrase